MCESEAVVYVIKWVKHARLVEIWQDIVVLGKIHSLECPHWLKVNTLQQIFQVWQHLFKACGILITEKYNSSPKTKDEYQPKTERMEY